MIKTIIEAVSFIVTGIIITLIFSFIKGKIFKRATSQVKQLITPKELRQKMSEKLLKHQQTNASVGRKLNKQGEEVFQAKKFFVGLNPFNLKLWAKSLVFLFRYFIIFSVIFGVVYGYGWWKGRGDTPVSIEIIGSQQEWELKIPTNAKRLYHPENSKQLYWINKSGKQTPVKVEDIPQLNELLRPYGISFTPIGVIGIGVGGEEGSGVEGGVGVRFLRYYRWRLDAFLTNRGIYAGVAYKLEGLKLSNSAVGLSIGKGWSGSNRLMFYFSMEF